MRTFGFLALPVAIAAAATLAACAGSDGTNGLNLGEDTSSGGAGDTDGGGTSANGDPTTGGGAATGDGGAKASDGGGTTSGDGGATKADGGGDAGVLCINGVTSPGSGHHNAGTNCQSCHDSLSASRRWTVAGTLYATANGGGAISGATIEVVDAANQTLKLTTYDNGNFYTITPVAYPIHLRASKCPADLKMTATANSGSCNMSGCHVSGMRIHL